MNKKTQSPDKYCKECRKSLSRRQYGSGKKLPHCSLSGGRVSYPVITQTEDRETRLRLILHALQVVRLSMERKRRECRKKPCCKSISVGDNATFIPENVTSGTHSIAQNSTSEHSVAQQSKEQPHFNSPLETAGEKAEGKKIGKEEISSGSSCGRDVSGSGKRKSGRRRLSMPFFRRLTGHRVTMRGCSIISVATVSRLQNSMRLSLKVISGLSAVRSGVGLPRCVAVEAR